MGERSSWERVKTELELEVVEVNAINRRFVGLLSASRIQPAGKLAHLQPVRKGSSLRSEQETHKYRQQTPKVGIESRGSCISWVYAELENLDHGGPGCPQHQEMKEIRMIIPTGKGLMARGEKSFQAKAQDHHASCQLLGTKMGPPVFGGY